MALEALNDCAKRTERLILVVNDNGSATSVAPLGALLESAGFEVTRRVDGHDIAEMEDVFAMAKAAVGPIAVLVTTVKGKGFPPAEADPTAWHGVGPFDLGDSAVPRPASGWSDVFGAAVCAAARRDSRVCALTAAMREGTGLVPFASEFPDRFFDVGICEEHLVTFAAGLAKGGMRPVVAVYSTFLQRAVDQVMHDVCLMNLPMVFGIDRAGAVGADGRTHHGMFDIPMLRCLPNLAILQPKDVAELKAMVDAALERNAPTAIRYPRGVPCFFKDFNDLKWGKAEQISGHDAPVQLWALGDQVAKALDVASLLEAQGVQAGVVNARFVKPFDADLLARQRSGGARIVTLENGVVAGGFGEAIGADMRFGWPDEFVAHGSVAELEAAYGFTPAAIAESILRSGPFAGNARP
jgi:1-deoxy-D-xylulose-5-phosphate synthase